MIELAYMIYLLLAIVLVWETSFAMIERKKITVYMPFFIVSLLWVVRIVIIIHKVTIVGIFNDLLEGLELICYIWIAFDLWCRKWK